MSERPETYQLRAMVMKGARISWEIPHARQQASARNVPLFVAERIIRMTGVVVEVRTEPNGQIRWTVAGADADGRPIHVSVKPIGDKVLRVVTVIRKDE